LIWSSQPIAGTPEILHTQKKLKKKKVIFSIVETKPFGSRDEPHQSWEENRWQVEKELPQLCYPTDHNNKCKSMKFHKS